MIRPEVGETFTAEIDRISNAGNGLIEVENGHHINIGPVTKDSDGEEITAEMVGGQLARCKTEAVMTDDYAAEFEELKAMIEYCAMCGVAMYMKDTSWVCRSCGYEASKRSSYIEQSQYSQNISSVETDESQVSGEPNNESNTPADTTFASQISDLRERAMESAVEEVPNNFTKTLQTTSEYSRSQAVVDYVKARADGICEGCGVPAPFVSKTGEPYLHAHHIHELSEGGSDNPETVIALCPNCHYRVHHGRDGDKYNQALIENLAEIEDVPLKQVQK